MNLFNFIKTQIPILQIISEYTTLKQAGIYWKGICPFHSEKTPSFSVSPHKDIYYCFGCHATGDVISFIAKIENYSQIEAAKFLTERFGLKIPKEINKDFFESEESKNEKNIYFNLCKTIAIWCHENLKKSNEALQYIKTRGFNNESIDKFLIGYLPSGSNSIKIFLKFMAKEGFLAQDLIKYSFLMEGKNQLYCPFEERIIFPIKDQLGRFCGFGGRIFKENDDRAKYYNSHENSYFNKGSLLFGIDLAKKAIQEKGFAFLVEGYTDCIAMMQNQYNNSIAVLGTACTIEHLKLLNRFTEKIYVLYDDDIAGQKAILRLTEMCWNVNMELRVVCLGNKEDPASFLYKKGDLDSLIKEAKDIYTFFIDKSGNNFSSKTLNEKIWTVKKLTDIIQNIDDQLKRDILFQEVANKLNISINSIKNSYNTELFAKNKQLIPKQDIKEIEDNENFKISNSEKRLFSIIMNNIDLFNNSYHYLCEFFISPLKEILMNLVNLKDSKDKIEFKFFFNSLNEEQKNTVNKSLLEYNKDSDKDFDNLIKQFQKKHWKQIAYNTQLKLKQAQINSDKDMANKIITEFQELKKKLVNGGCDA